MQSVHRSSGATTLLEFPAATAWTRLVAPRFVAPACICSGDTIRIGYHAARSPEPVNFGHSRGDGFRDLLALCWRQGQGLLFVGDVVRAEQVDGLQRLDRRLIIKQRLPILAGKCNALHEPIGP